MKIDDRELLRDVEKMPLEARAALEKTRVAKAERRLGLAPFDGDSPLIEKAAKARLEAAKELQKVRYPARYRRAASDLKQKGAGFWAAHQTLSPLEALVSMELGLEPFEAESPDADAASAVRIRFMTELHEMDSLPAVQGRHLSSWRRRAILSSLAKQEADFWLKVQDRTAARLYKTHALETPPADLVPFDVVSRVEHEAAEAYARLMDELHALPTSRLMELERIDTFMLQRSGGALYPDTLLNKGAEFWYAHRDFTAEELIASVEENLTPFLGDTEETRAASKARARLIAEMRDLKGREGYLGTPLYRSAFNLKQKEAAFWYAHRDFNAKELIVSQFLDIKPFQSVSPAAQTASKARARIFAELYDLRWAEHQITGRYQQIVTALKTKEADFWYAHQDFTALELLELHFPEAEQKDRPASRAMRLRWPYLTWTAVGLAVATTIMWGFGALAAAAYLILFLLVVVGFVSDKLGN